MLFYIYSNFQHKKVEFHSFLLFHHQKYRKTIFYLFKYSSLNAFHPSKIHVIMLVCTVNDSEIVRIIFAKCAERGKIHY